MQRIVFYLNSRSVVELTGFPTYEDYYPCVSFGNAGYQVLPLRWVPVLPLLWVPGTTPACRSATLGTRSLTITPNTVELIPICEALFPQGGPVQDPVLTQACRCRARGEHLNRVERLLLKMAQARPTWP